MMLNEIISAKMACDGGTMLGVVVSPILALTDAVSISIATSVATVAVAGISAYFAYKAKTISQEAKAITEETHKAVNGQMTQFKEMAQKAYHAEGKEEARAEDKVIAAAEAKGRAEAVAIPPLMTSTSKEQAVPIPLPITVVDNKTP